MFVTCVQFLFFSVPATLFCFCCIWIRTPLIPPALIHGFWGFFLVSFLFAPFFFAGGVRSSIPSPQSRCPKYISTAKTKFYHKKIYARANTHYLYCILVLLHCICVLLFICIHTHTYTHAHMHSNHSNYVNQGSVSCPQSFGRFRV